MPKKPNKSTAGARTSGAAGARGQDRGNRQKSQRIGTSSSKNDVTDSDAKPHAPSREEKLWAARFTISEKARKDHRENASLLIQANAELEKRMLEMERDTMEVVAYLRRDLAKAEDELKAAKDQVAEVKLKAQHEIESVEDDCNNKIMEVQQQLKDRTVELEHVRRELIGLHEFKQRREEIEREVLDLQDQNKHQEANFEKEKQAMETKFFEEKARLQQTTERQLDHLAKKAHEAAIQNLDMSARNAFEENERLVEQMKLHVSENSRLQQEVQSLHKTNTTLKFDEHNKDEMLKQEIEIAHQYKEKAQALQKKVSSLEKRLTSLMHEHTESINRMEQQLIDSTRELKYELATTQQALNLKAAELKRIRYLARNVLFQRTEVEQFLIDSLQFVRQQIAIDRAQYMKMVKNKYNKDMRAGATTGQLPKVTSFSKGGANNFAAEFEKAEAPISAVEFASVDIKSLTWEQREQVLKRVFMKINQSQRSKRSVESARKTPSSAVSNTSTLALTYPEPVSS